MSADFNPTNIVGMLGLFFLIPFMMFVPGFLLVGYQLKERIDALITSILVSSFVLFLLTGLLYQLSLDSWAYYIIAFACLLWALYKRMLLWELRKNYVLKAFLFYFALFVLIMLGYTLLIYIFSGGNWSGDWEEHYFRTLFYKNFWEKNILLRGFWSIPARPPLMNVLASFFMHFSYDDFRNFQVIQLILNSFEFFGVLYFLWVVVRQRDVNNITGDVDRIMLKSFLLITVFMVLNPSEVQNITYPWNKSFFSFFTLVALSFSYRRFYTYKEMNRFHLSIGEGLALGLAMLTHYGTISYIIGLFFVDLWHWRGVKKIEFTCMRWKYLTMALVCAPWFLWAYYYYGSDLFSATSTAKNMSHFDLEYLGTVILKNSWVSLYPSAISYFPLVFKNIPNINVIDLRDLFFMIYQVNFLFLMGSCLWFIAFKELWRMLSIKMIVLFTLFFIIVWSISMGAIGRDYPFGVAHISLRPLALLGLVVVVMNFFTLSVLTRKILIGSVLFDWAFGVVLHFFIQAKYLVLEDFLALKPAIYFNIQNKIQGGYFFLSEFKGGYFSAFILFFICLYLIIRRIKKLDFFKFQ